MCEEVFDHCEISKEIFLESQAHYLSDPATKDELTQAVHTGKLSTETLKAKPALAKSMQLSIVGRQDQELLKRDNTVQALKESNIGYERQRSQKQDSLKKLDTRQDTVEDIIQDLVMKARANDEVFRESAVSEEQVENAMLYYHVVEGQPISDSNDTHSV